MEPLSSLIGSGYKPGSCCKRGAVQEGRDACTQIHPGWSSWSRTWQSLLGIRLRKHHPNPISEHIPVELFSS